MNSSENKLPTFLICLKSPAHCRDSISRLPEIVLHKLMGVTHDIFCHKCCVWCEQFGKGNLSIGFGGFLDSSKNKLPTF